MLEKHRALKRDLTELSERALKCKKTAITLLKDI